VAAARDGIALNKWGRQYRRSAWKDLEGSLNSVPDPLAQRRLGDITRGDVQRLVDEMRRYTHTLPRELERARDQLDRFLVERTRERRRARK
jgi:hypothetical protein